MLKVFVLIFLYCASPNEASRILAVFPTPSISHQVTFRPLTQELVKRGHEVVVITTDPAFSKDETPVNLTEIDVHDMSYKLWIEKVMTKVDNGNKNELKNLGRHVFEMLQELFRMQMRVDEVQQIIKKKTKPFDLILIEAYMLSALGFSHIFKAPVILMSSFLPVYTDVRILGAPNHPFLYPGVHSQMLGDLSLHEKVQELLNYLILNSGFARSAAFLDDTVNKVFGPDVPKVIELCNNVDMLFINSFPIWDSNRPVPPSIQYLGGIHVKPLKELPADLKSYLDSSKHGVIYISFGTNVNPSTLPQEKVQAIINVMSRLPYDVIWKWDKDELPGRTKNIKISKWLPQSDLLRHPNIKFFITQAGLQSTDEAIVAGVPLLAIPMWSDQWYNAAMYVKHKIGVKVELEDLNEQNLKAAVDDLLKDDTYRQNMAKFRSVVYDQPQRPIERAVWWTEYVLRHGGARHLRSPAANMSWTTYYEVELLSYVLLAVLTVISVVFIVIFKLVNLYHSKTIRKLKNT